VANGGQDENREKGHYHGKGLEGRHGNAPCVRILGIENQSPASLCAGQIDFENVVPFGGDLKDQPRSAWIGVGEGYQRPRAAVVWWEAAGLLADDSYPVLAQDGAVIVIVRAQDERAVRLNHSSRWPSTPVLGHERHITLFQRIAVERDRARNRGCGQPIRHAATTDEQQDGQRKQWGGGTRHA